MAKDSQQQTVTAQLRYLRITARKVRLVADLMRGMSVEEAQTQLELLPHHAARPLLKLVRSASKNGENLGFDPQSLFISNILVGDGPILKRWMPRARGVASPLYKRTSHIFIELQPIDSTKITKRVTDITTKKEKIEDTEAFGELEEKADAAASDQPEEQKPTEEHRREMPKKERRKDNISLRNRKFMPKMFRRKSV